MDKCAVEKSALVYMPIWPWCTGADGYGRLFRSRVWAEEDTRGWYEHWQNNQQFFVPRGKRCVYEGATPPGGFPNSWNGASSCTSDLAILNKNEVHTWDRGYDDDGNQVWGVKEGPYEFKPAVNCLVNYRRKVKSSC